MADVQPLRTLRYEPSAVGSLEDVIAPPYDVIDAAERAQLLERSPFNVVEIDLPQAANGGDPYEHARDTLDEWRREGVVVTEPEPAMWALEQDYTAPDGGERTRRGFFARVRVEDYGAGRIRPARAHAPRAQGGPAAPDARDAGQPLPIFSLFPDPDNAAVDALAKATAGDPFGTASDSDGTRNSLWRIGEPELIAELQGAAGGRRAADRRRPSPLRDRARLRRRDRRRGRAPLRADVPVLALRPRPDGLPDPPAAVEPEGV